MALLHSIVVIWIGFLQAVHSKGLWSSSPSAFDDLIRNAYPIGNGRLAALPFGEPGNEKLSLNRDNLWSGGPFENSSYNGGNPLTSVASALPGIRSWIFQNGTGNVTALMGDDNNYGSYYVLGNLSVSFGNLSDFTAYNRSLDLSTGVHRTTFQASNTTFETNAYCSYPDSVCVYELSSSSTLPVVQISFENQQANESLVNSACSVSTRTASFVGITQAEIGMIYRAEARVIGTNSSLSCNNDTGVLTIIPRWRSLAIVIAAGTNYDETRGTSAANYSFRGPDPGDYIATAAAQASSKGEEALRKAHLEDFSALFNTFSLELPDTANSAGKETAQLIATYNGTTDTEITRDPYVEALLFDYGRYLLISSSRPNSLPPNLQGKWAYSTSNAWGADYHANINLQMNHWGADQTGLGNLQSALWKYMAETWVPRGTSTAKLLYDAPGWVVHDEVNIFGHTGMKTGDEYWADYAASAAWMMLHVFDHYDYSRDTTWLRETGFPLLQGVAEFWLSQLQEDIYFNDGTLVVNPCSSPEHGPTTFGCAHFQQLIHSLFTNTLLTASTLYPTSPLIPTLTSALQTLDKGIHIGSFHQLQEWKLDLDVQNDTHRHLSHLIGWFPGSSISGTSGGYKNTTLFSAVRVVLENRGPGIADANAGWEKLWRAACWARLNSSSEAYYELRLTVAQNIAGNGLSMYSGKNEPFQIDANFGFVGAVLGMLVVDLEGVQDVVLGPAVPGAWGGGMVKGLRVRGGGKVGFRWDMEGKVTWAECKGTEGRRVVNLEGEVLC